MNIKAAFLAVAALFLAGCASTFQYSAGSEEYRNKPLVISSVKVEVRLDSAKQPKGYLTETEIAETVRADMIRLLQENNAITYIENAADGLSTTVKLNYFRKFSYGDAIAKPEFSGSIYVDHGSKRLGSRSFAKATTKFGGFTDALVNAEVGVGKWDHEDEPRDLEVIASVLVSDLEGF